MMGLHVVVLESVVSVLDIFTTTAGNFRVILWERLKMMAGNSIVGCFGNLDYVTVLVNLVKMGGVKVFIIKPRWSG